MAPSFPTALNGSLLCAATATAFRNGNLKHGLLAALECKILNLISHALIIHYV